MFKVQGGITLIELLGALLLVLVVVSLALPSFASLRQQSQVRSAGMAVYAHLQLARSEAIKRNRDITLCFSGSATSGWQYHINELAHASDCESETLATLVSLTSEQHPRVLLTMAYPEPYLIFKPRRATLTAGHIKVAQQAWAVKIITWNNGIIRTCSEHLLAGVAAC
ncbi:MAG: type IV pilin [Aeromonadales bacterium]|nr:type IV pilin [Aeromonadales bacterium]